MNVKVDNGYQTPLTQTRSTQKIETEASVGAGASAQVGEAPDTNTQTFNIMTALSQFKPVGDPDFEILLAAVTQKMKDVQTDTQTERVIANQEVQQLNSEENVAKMEESIRKQEKAAEKTKEAKIWGKISEIASYVGVGVMAALGAIAILTGAGVGLGALLIASAVVMAAQIADQKLVAEKNGGAGSLALLGAEIDKAIKGDKYDPDSKSSQKLMMALNITQAVVFAAINICLAVATGNVAAASNAINTIKVIAVATEVATTVTASSADIGRNAVQLESAKLSKGAEKDKADALDVQAENSTLDDMIDQALKVLMASGEEFNAMLDKLVEMLNDTGASVQRTQFMN